MSKPLRPKRGTTAENDAFTGLPYEVTLDTDTHRLRTHDGVTAGGYEHALTSDIPGVMTGATDSAPGTSGRVPVPAKGDQDKVLLGNASWKKLSEHPDFVDLADRVTEAESKTGLPLGHFFTWPFSTPPNGSIIVNGATYSRSLYADLWAYVSSNSGWVKTESEWQSIASANGGFCPYYSSGDGSTTFRVPKFAPYQQIAISAANVGTYHQAGLPDIDGYISDITSTQQGANASFTGAFRKIRDYASAAWAGATSMQRENEVEFKASYSNQHYGRSDTVQPEANEWIVCVVAYGSATNVGNVDVANVMSAVDLVQADVADKLDNTIPHIVEFWHSNDWSNWYKKWSTGLIEQCGYKEGIFNMNTKHTFLTNFSGTGYIVLSNVVVRTSNMDYSGASVVCEKGTSTFSVECIRGITPNTTYNKLFWYACGY